MNRFRLALAGLAVACAGSEAQAPVFVPSGQYQLGSDAKEREWGYQNAPPVVREQQWYDTWERPPEAIAISGFEIDRSPVTQERYAVFVRATGRPVPRISRESYQRQGFLAHPYAALEPYQWRRDAPPGGLEDHPVVLVSRDDAEAYCSWRGARLPTEVEWESACRGRAHRLLPWGDAWASHRAQIEASGTAPVTAHPLGLTPDGIQDLAGNVFEWTATPFDQRRTTLKGCSWDDAPGTCRCAFRHGRPPGSRHMLIGFRCANDR